MSVSNLGNKIFSFYNEAKKLYNNQMILPRFVSMWLTTTCQYNCSYCYFSSENKERKFANTEKAKKFIKQIAKLGIESIEYSGGGEPTLHPDFYEIAKFAYDNGLKVGLLTNGFKLDYNKMKFFSYIRIGVDASDSETYKKLKNTNDGQFESLIEKINTFLCLRDNNIRPRIGLKFMINKDNCNEIKNMIIFAKNMKVDYCHFKSTHTDDNKLSDFELKHANNIIEAFKNTYQQFIYGGLIKNDAHVKCFMSPIHTVITPDGNALVCCYFTNKDRIIGNVFENDFTKIWFSKRHDNIINSINISECDKIDCRWNYYNKEMTAIIKDEKYDMSFI